MRGPSIAKFLKSDLQNGNLTRKQWHRYVNVECVGGSD